MGFHVRKSLRVGPFRFNLSKSGVGVSAGVKGIRIGTGPRGNYVRIGADGLRYRTSLPAGNASHPHLPRPPVPGMQSAPEVATFERIDSGDVLRMVDSTSAALLEEINARHRQGRLWPWVAAAMCLLILLAFPTHVWIARGLLLLGAAATVWAYWRDEVAGTVVLLYDLDAAADAAFQDLHDAFLGMASAHRAWNVDARAAVTDSKRNAGANTLLQRAGIALTVGAPTTIKTNITVPVVPAGTETLYFFPDRVLVFSPRGVGAVGYDQLRIAVSSHPFVETDPVPADARVVGRTWRYVNKDGRPDRRFRDNPEIPVVLYEQVHFASGTGLNELLQLSRTGGGERFRAAASCMAEVSRMIPRAGRESTVQGPAVKPVDVPTLAFSAVPHDPPAQNDHPSPSPRPEPVSVSPPQSPPVSIPAPIVANPETSGDTREVGGGSAGDSVSEPAKRARHVPAEVPPPSVPPRDTARSGISPRPVQSGARWVPPGESVEVGGYVLRDGMVFVGQGMRAAVEWRGAEPALIDPRLELASGSQADGATAGYWPSYSTVSPAFRARYLRWLAGGRMDPGADLGCVFLFFYGIERRILVDAEREGVSSEEIALLVTELERLLGLYGESGSFRNYAGSFLDFVRIRQGLMDLEPGAPPTERTGYELPFGVRAVLGRFASARTPIPAEWALAWVRFSPLVSLRTPAVRCSEEFEIAFRVRYHQRFGEGMVLKPNRTPLSVTYQPASASFSGQIFRVRVDDLPDVGVLQAPLDRLRQVAEAATDVLDRYSRWVGRTGEGDSLAALALLPPEVLRKRIRRKVPPLLADLMSAMGPDGYATVSASVLTYHWPGQRADRLSKKEAEGLTELLEKCGLGIAPDVRHTGINPSQAEFATVFLLPGEASVPGPDLAPAILLLNLAAAVAGSDELARAEEEEIERHLEVSYHLGAADRARLRAHLTWVRVCPPSTAGLKKQVEQLPAEGRAAVARALVAIAGADGHVSPAEVRMLIRLYPLLGLDEKQVYADVHALAAGGSAPVTVLPAEPATEYAIPRPEPEPTPAPAPTGFVLDTTRIAAIQHETRDVTRVLASVFAGEEPEEAAPPPYAEASSPAPEDDVEDPPGADDRLPGLDAAHSALVRVLGERTEWRAAEVSAFAERHGLLAAGAMETINDAAFQLCDEPLLEGIDPIEVNPYAREEMFA